MLHSRLAHQNSALQASQMAQISYEPTNSLQKIVVKGTTFITQWQKQLSQSFFVLEVDPIQKHSKLFSIFFSCSPGQKNRVLAGKHIGVLVM